MALVQDGVVMVNSEQIDLGRQPNYRQLLTADDALVILINTHNLIGVLLPPQ